MRKFQIALLMLHSTWAADILDFPQNIERVIINIGPNTAPALPAPQDLHNTVAIAFEPIVGCKIRNQDGLHIVHAAVSSKTSLQFMGVFNVDGLSSSLAAPSTPATWNFGKNKHARRLVPVLGIDLVLMSLSIDVELWYLKTDMQGFDFDTLKGGGVLITRAHYVLSEVWWNKVRTYEGVDNDFCVNQYPLMTKLGFELIKTEGGYRQAGLGARGINILNGKTHEEIIEICASQHGTSYSVGANEGDAFWKRKGTTLPEPRWREKKENPGT